MGYDGTMMLGQARVLLAAVLVLAGCGTKGEQDASPMACGGGHEYVEIRFQATS